MTEYLTAAEVAEKLRKTPWYVRRLCRTGQLEAATIGREWRITPTAVEAFVAANVHKPAQPKGRRRPRRGIA
ncbi:MAG: helix-turn-helix domain-containing protein [Mycobacteriaceae bacterium]